MGFPGTRFGAKLRHVRGGRLALLLLIGCEGRRPPTPPPEVRAGASAKGNLAATSPSPDSRPASAGRSGVVLLDVTSEREASVVAVVERPGWRPPGGSLGTEVLRRIVRPGAIYLGLPQAAGSKEPIPVGQGKLSGEIREECGYYAAALVDPTDGRGFAVVGATSATARPNITPRLQELAVQPSYIEAVRELVKRVAKQKVTPTIERAYEIDLDGNGKPETLLQATHPDLNGDPAKYLRKYYSVLVVLSDVPGAEPVFTGYLQGARNFAFFEVLTIDSAADVDGDGKPELLVRARTAEGWQTQAFRYDGGLKEIFRSVGGEGQCPGAAD